MTTRHGRSRTLDRGKAATALVRLFGHEKGVSTGATARKVGRFELAGGGTMLLDEIGELPLDFQARRLRVLQHGSMERLGSSTTTQVETRVIATTNRHLTAASAAGELIDSVPTGAMDQLVASSCQHKA